MNLTKTTTFKALFLSTFTAISMAATADVSDTIEKTFNLNSDGKIRLKNINGNVTFKACDCSQVTMVANISASSQEMRDRISIDIDDSSDRLSIKTKYKKNRGSSWNNQHSEVVYELQVPNTVNLDGINLVNGSLKISGVSGELDADLVNGNLDSDGLSSSTRVKMVNGDITLKFTDLTNADKVDLESVNGKIEVYMPAHADVSVSAETVSGQISNEFGLNVIKHKYVGSEMKGNVGSGRVTLNMDNVNGKIALKSL